MPSLTRPRVINVILAAVCVCGAATSVFAQAPGGGQAWDEGARFMLTEYLEQPPRADPPALLDAPTPYAAPVAEETGDPDTDVRFRMFEDTESNTFRIGTDLYSAPDFKGGLIVYGEDVALKIGGYVKADMIYDFDPIDETDSFVTTSIPVGAPGRTNSRFHARQTRLSFDTRWASEETAIRIFVECDFFSEGDQWRLRHAYGEIGEFTIGQTWTTFTDVAAAPATLDFEGSVSAVNRRQALARWTRAIGHDDLRFSFAVEDTRYIIVVPDNVMGESRSPSPDVVARIRLEREWGRFQLAHLYRIGGFQKEGQDLQTGAAWGFNFTGVLLLSEKSKAYYQMVFGEGIGSYRGLPDAVPGLTGEVVLPMFGWMVGVTHEWNNDYSSNFTYAENILDNPIGQNADEIHRATYLAANVMWKPYDRVRTGIEYLYGLRENVNGRSSAANRVQVAVIFDLP